MHFLGAKSHSMSFEDQERQGLSRHQEAALTRAMCLLYHLLEYLANNHNGNLPKAFEVVL